MKTILICTVGGSHQPIVKSINENKPDFVYFLCSDKDPATGAKGSCEQITGKEIIVNSKTDGKAQTLPNIPTQTNLASDAYEVVIIPSDDLDKAFCLIRKKIEDIHLRWKGQRILGDFTGGTKSMTAALVTAILESDDINLVFVTGSRGDLVRVRDGTEHSAPAAVEEMRLYRRMAPFEKTWERFAFDEALEGFESIPMPTNSILRSRLSFARDFSKAFSAWDRFDHAQARMPFDAYSNRISRCWLDQYLFLKVLTEEVNPAKKELARIIDLALNAQRRAKQGRYDDAVARLYRIIEWFAQWLLETHCELKTGDLALDKVPEEMRAKIRPDDEGKFKIGLWLAWEIVSMLIPGKFEGFFQNESKALLSHLKKRNNSILAHGFSPVSKADWNGISSWFEDRLFPLVLDEAKKLKVSKCPQLPTVLPNDDSVANRA